MRAFENFARVELPRQRARQMTLAPSCGVRVLKVEEQADSTNFRAPEFTSLALEFLNHSYDSF